MTQILNKRNSIYVQLLRLLLISAVFSGIVFYCLDIAGEYLIGTYIEKTNYQEQENQKYVKKMQYEIDKNQLSSKDMTEIKNWVKKQKILSIKIYKNDIQIFDSDYPDQDILEEEISAGKYAWESYYPIVFSDGKAEVIITGAYSYSLYMLALIIEICFSFIIFLGVVLFGIRKKMKYILKLSEEIEILEGGSLEYPITIQGKDELSVLAEGLDSMRNSFKKLINQESEMARENQRIVTEMSHDLRTPVTSIILYTEILKKKQYKNEVQLNSYIDKIDRKAHRMKQLTDHLFEYSLVAGKEDVASEEPELYKVLFYDLLSETCSYLNQHGFKIDFRVKWIDCKIRISTDYLMRIMDNITSNIIKYADPSYEILVSSVQQKEAVGFLFENTIRKTNKIVESTGIGMQNIKNMMLNMGGECRVKQTKDKYCLVLLFPYSEYNKLLND